MRYILLLLFCSGCELVVVDCWSADKQPMYFFFYLTHPAISQKCVSFSAAVDAKINAALFSVQLCP